MGFNEADTRAKLIDPMLHSRGWTEDLINREETAGTIDIVNGRPRKQSDGRIDYTLRIKVDEGAQPVAVALIEAKAEDLLPDHGLEQGKLYADAKRLNVPFVFGCVARNLRGMLEVCNLTFLFSLDSHSKQAGDECHLLHAVSFFYAMHLT